MTHWGIRHGKLAQETQKAKDPDLVCSGCCCSDVARRIAGSRCACCAKCWVRFFFVCQIQLHANEIEQQRIGCTDVKALKFMRATGGQASYFDTAAAEAGGADAATLEVGAIVNSLAAGQNNGGGDQAAAKLGLPIWGKWCGPGHGGGAAVDVLDSICRTHDKCYGSRGYFACSCDRAIISDINRNTNKMKTQERVTAAAVSVYFTYCMCNPFK